MMAPRASGGYEYGFIFMLFDDNLIFIFREEQIYDNTSTNKELTA